MPQTVTDAPAAPAARRVAGKNVIVTGGSGDLGKAVVRLLVEHGAQVASLDVRKPDEPWSLDAVQDYEVDITDDNAVSAVVNDVARDLGSPDVLVNAAGIIGPGGPSHETSETDFDRIFAVNVKGTWLMTKHVVPHMIEAGRGSIINFSSIYGIAGGKSVPLYHATKGAVRLLTKADAATYGESGIRVNSVHPGSMNTSMSRQAAASSPLGREEYYRRLYGNNPLPRQGEPFEIAYGVLYLASDESTFTTGAELVIDGGFTAI